MADRFFLALLGLALANTSSLAATLYIDPSGSNGTGTIGSPFNSWANAGPLVAGNTYLQKVGTTGAETITVTVANLTIGSYNTGANPIQGAFNFSTGASNNTLTGFTLTGAPGFGIGFQNGASGNSVSYCTTTGGTVGILFSTGAGSGNVVNNNTVQNATEFGIDVAQGTTGETIFSNVISGSAAMGIELEGNSSSVEFNEVTTSGASTPGSSGIHTYTTSVANGGNNNIIDYNIVTTTSDQSSGDGNGIQLDQWTHNNLVTGNVVHNNQGAGISIYGSWGNYVTLNGVFNDMLGVLSNHGTRCEICVTTNVGGAIVPNHDNIVSGNVTNATVGGVQNVFVDAGSTGKQSVWVNTGQLQPINIYGAWVASGVPSPALSALHTELELMASF